VLSVSLGIAVGASALFDVSFALGAFLAGTVVNGSRLSRAAAAGALPLQDAFSVLFFVAVGMLFDPAIVVRRPVEVATVIAIVVLGKSLAAVAIVRACGAPVAVAFTLAACLAQIGEFSFLLAGLALSLGLLPVEAPTLIVAGAMCSIALNPALFWLAERATRSPSRSRA
jgi:CPA2 family monovalent cation:H+ antiporter-2